MLRQNVNAYGVWASCYVQGIQTKNENQVKKYAR